ncbi:MAG TPA: hypothetical protein VD963_06850 [Phycisphaerales bacterium]|nr:hypothetical protein [Phycisphaerales bacterium]
MPPRTSIPRSLGEFFGHIVKALRTDVSRPAPAAPPDPPAGVVTLRRTTIEEVSFRHPAAGGPPRPATPCAGPGPDLVDGAPAHPAADPQAATRARAEEEP